MKAFVILCLVVGTLGSLEPAGYQPPSARYLPANRQNNGTSDSFNDYRMFPSHQNPIARYLPTLNSDQENPIQLTARQYLPSINDRSTFDQFKPQSSSFSRSSFSSPSSSFPSNYHQSSSSAPHSSTSSVFPSSSTSHSSPSGSYSSPSRSASFLSASMSYGLPSIELNKITTGTPSAQYLSSNTKDYSSRLNYQTFEESEPANYNFEYRVNDDYGNDFGHKENRQDEKSYGVYSVLLPDGRKQIVEYEADEEGFRPKISYEEIGDGFQNARDHEEGPY